MDEQHTRNSNEFCILSYLFNGFFTYFTVCLMCYDWNYYYFMYLFVLFALIGFGFFIFNNYHFSFVHVYRFILFMCIQIHISFFFKLSIVVIQVRDEPFFLLLCRHTASPPITAGTHTSGVQ